MRIRYLVFLASCIILSTLSCKQSADLIIYNARIYTVDDSFRIAEATAIRDGKFIDLGQSDAILKKYDATEKIDAGRQCIYPGIIDAHCHFYGYGMGLYNLNLVGTQSLEGIMDSIDQYIKKYPDRKWIIGRGWDQNDWEDKGLPTNDLLNQRFPNHCVVLKRVDGHALLANQKAIEASGNKPFTGIGGSITTYNGKNLGLYIDNAMELIEHSIPPLTEKEVAENLLEAQKNCLQAGLTSICEAGLELPQIAAIQKLQSASKLHMRIYAMVAYSPQNLAHYIQKGPFKNEQLHIRSFKLFADGALGSRGACLRSPYADAHHHRGFMLKSAGELDSIVKTLDAHHFQVNTHCIGDSANRSLLKIYGRYLPTHNDKRWRIEHAQVISPEDFGLFAQHNIIPSVQPTHATSDMYWAESRLGKARLKNAYAYKKLLETSGILACGTDFPVEDINPMYTFCSAVFRMDKNNYPASGFQMENALSREDALRSMTIWAAYAQFEEKEKGSIEIGKLADFIIMPVDLMKEDFHTIRNAKIKATFIGGKKVYESSK
jgi:predicted amidohydrolase YtcJ